MIWSIFEIIVLVVVSYGIYYVIKEKNRSYRGLYMDDKYEGKALLFLFFVVLYIASEGFMYMNFEAIDWPNHLFNQEITFIPFEELSRTIASVKFQQFIMGDTNWTKEAIGSVWISYGKGLLAVLPLPLFGIILFENKWLRLLFPVAFGLILPLIVGKGELMTLVIISLVAIVIIYLFEFIIRTISMELIHINGQSVTIAQIVLLVIISMSMVHYSNLRLFRASNSMESVSRNVTISMMDDQLNYRVNEFLVSDDRVMVEGFLYNDLSKDVPYKYTRVNYTVKQSNDGIISEVGRGFDSNRLTIDFDNDYFDYDLGEWRTVDLYPWELYGITEIEYRIEDKALLNQFKLIEETFLTDEPYLIFRQVYVVPKVEGYLSDWHIRNDFKGLDGVFYTYDTRRSVVENVVSETTETMRIERITYFEDLKLEAVGEVETYPNACVLSIESEEPNEVIFLIEDASYFEQ